MGHPMARLALALGFACLVGMAENTHAGTSPEPATGEVVDFITRQDLVAWGTIASVDTVTRGTKGGCGLPGFGGPPRDLEVLVKVTRLVHGALDGSTFTLILFGTPAYAFGALLPGAEVLAHGTRSCEDDWRLRGHLEIVSARGVMVRSTSSEEPLLSTIAPGRPVTRRELESAIENRTASTHQAAVEGQSALGLARVSHVAPASNGILVSLDSLGWCVGSERAMPRRVVFTRQHRCTDGLEVGDSLLIPSPRESAGAQVLRTCPAGLRVQYAYCPGFGVPLSRIGHAVKSSPRGLRVAARIHPD